MERLERHCGRARNFEENYVRFNAAAGGYEIELIALRGHQAQVDRWLIQYLLEQPELSKEYEQLKRRYAFSRREYQRQEDKFFRRVVAAIPDN